MGLYSIGKRANRYIRSTLSYRIGNAQTIGSYQVQSNYFSTKNGGYALAVLADGTIDHINGRRCAILAVEACMQEFYSMPSGVEILPFFDDIAEKVLYEMRNMIYLGKTPNLSLSILFVRNGEVFSYSVGDNQVFLFDGREYHLLKNRSGRAAFLGGMTAGMVSKGVWNAMQEREMISYLGGKKHPFDKAQQMILRVREKNIKGAGNATVILVEDSL